jgi:hypothetical protein
MNRTTHPPKKSVSDKQREANRRNGRRGAGRKSQRGRDVCRYNSTRHGMTARKLIRLPQEEAEYQRLKTQLYREWSPQGATEITLVDDIAKLTWLIERGDAFAIESDKVVACTIPVDELFEPTRKTLEFYDKAWRFKESHARCREKLDKQRMAARFQLERLQARRREMLTIRGAIPAVFSANTAAARDTPAETRPGNANGAHTPKD